MQGEDAPQTTNTVDLDPHYRDIDGLAVPRITYKNHPWELKAREEALPKMLDIIGAAGAKYGIPAPIDDVPASRHVLGTLRMGLDPKTSVCGGDGRFHDIGNLYCSDGALFPTSTGSNPTLTIMTLGSRVGAMMVNPQNPESLISNS